MSNQVDAAISDFARKIADSCPEIQSVWLFGSRANGNAQEWSDWDLLAFGSENTIAYLSAHQELHRSDIDFFVVTNGDDFSNAWGENKKIGSLTEWEWTQKSEFEAEYIEAKLAPGTNWGASHDGLA